MAVKKSELYSSLWASCDSLRGGMDSSQYKDYILTLLFVKYVSDSPYDLVIIPKGGGTTAGLARMNLILHNKATAEIKGGYSTLRQFDFVVVNPPFSDKNWTHGLKEYGRFDGYGDRPPQKNGDFAWLFHILKSLKRNGNAEANLWNMRQFSTHCVENLSWTNIRIIMRLDDEKERNYYLQEAACENWSSRQLERNIKSGYYRRLLLRQNEGKIRKNPIPAIPNVAEFIKDPYILEFLNISEDIRGKETILENAIITYLQKFLMEMGKGFSFVGRQFRISTETSHFYIDLVFYNYLLKCFVVIDLKTKKLTHQDIGQMEMYVRMFDDLKRREGKPE